MQRTIPWIFALVFSTMLLLALPGQAMAASACSLCYDCGGKWSTFSGVVPTRQGARPYSRGPACSGDLTPTSDTTPYLCCQDQGEVTPPPPSGATPNDSMYAQQWGYENIGMSTVWRTTSTQTVSPVTVAVIDTGIYAGGHPDLPPRSPNNAHFLNSGADISTGVNAADTLPEGSHHGTHVSGTILATTNNNTGVAGAPWNQSGNSGVNHISVKVLGTDGSGTFDDVIQGIYYAAGISNRHGLSSSQPAKVISMSLGGAGNCSPTLESAIGQAVAAGSAVIVAAGNTGDNSPQQPASCPSVTLTVGATDINNQLASFSSYGFSDLSAPGVNILSTYRNPDYSSLSGTSMATPHVSGATTVLLQKNPSLSPAQIKALLVNNAQSFGDSRMGAGILRVPGAFQAATAAERISEEILAMDNNDRLANPGEISVNAEFVPGEILVRYKQPRRALEKTEKLLGDRATLQGTTANPDIPVLIRLSGSEVAGMSEAELKQATLDAIAELLKSPDVAYAEPNYIFRGFH